VKRLALMLATAAAGLGLGCGVALAAGPPSGWSWLLGTNTSSATIGQLTDSPDVYAGAYYGGAIPAQLSGGEFSSSDQYGYYEFEHGAAAPNTVFMARAQNGSPTPMTIGKVDGQDVTPLIVAGVAGGMSSDLQSWQAGSTSPSGIDNQGRLRLNGIVLVPTVSNGKVRLEAVLPDGSTQLLVPVR
jgi:hypothetical protein